MGIGICLEGEASKNKFVGGLWDSEGHGNYLVGSGGYTYSTSDLSVNGKALAF
jgi:hypothetical protein